MKSNRNIFLKIFIILIFFYLNIFSKFYDLDLSNLENDLEKASFSINSFSLFIVLFIMSGVTTSLVLKFLQENYSILDNFIRLSIINLISFSLVFYLLRIYISRLYLITSIVFASLFLLILLKIIDKNITFVAICSILLGVYITPFNDIYSDYVFESDFNDCINSFSTSNNDEENFIYIVGHAYGSFETKGDALSPKLLNYFDENLDQKENMIVLTGDIAHTGTVQNYELARQQIRERFEDAIFAVGNHESYSIDNFLRIFDKDLFIKEYNGFSLISANFSNSKWQILDKDKDVINQYLDETTNEVIFLFSHQVFWIKDVKGEPMMNGTHLLEVSLEKDTLNWLNLENKKLIVISGDSGGKLDARPFCELSENGNLYIANGINDVPTDSILRINFNNETKSFNINKINLNN